MKTKVINIRNKTGSPDEVYVGRPGIFGNPFLLGKHGDRDMVVTLHESYMITRMGINPEFREQIRSLYGKTLMCFCAPRNCHAYNLAAMADQLANEEEKN